MFIRPLKSDEMELIKMVECFIRESASDKGAGDPSQTFETVRLALEIGQKIPHPINPLILVLTTLFQDLGRRMTGDTSISGFMAAALSESFLKVTTVTDIDRLQIARAVSKAGARGVVPLDTVEQLVVADCVRLNRLGMIAVVDLLAKIGGDHETALRDHLQECRDTYAALHFEESKELGKPLLEQSEILVESLGRVYSLRPSSLEEIDFPQERR